MAEALRIVGDESPWWMRDEEQVWLKPGYWGQHLSPLLEQVERNRGKPHNFYESLFDFASMTCLDKWGDLLTVRQVYAVILDRLLGNESEETTRKRLLQMETASTTPQEEVMVRQLCQNFYTNLVENDFGVSLEKKINYIQREFERLGIIDEAYGQIVDLYLSFHHQGGGRQGRSRLKFIHDPIRQQIEVGELAFLSWLDLITTPDYWRPTSDSATFLFVDREQYPKMIPRYFQLAQGEKLYAFGFDGRLGMFNFLEIPFEEIQKIWDWMYKFGIYDTSYSDKEKRDFVMNLMIKLLPKKGLWVDVAGGEGELAMMARKHGQSGEVVIVDGSSVALNRARSLGFGVKSADLRQLIPLADKCAQVVTSGFAVHVLGLKIYREMYRVLRPGGKAMINWYPKDESHLQEIIKQLAESGFRVILRPSTFVRQKSSDHGPAGEMSTEVIIEAVKP